MQFMGIDKMLENDKIEIDKIDYSQVNPKKLNGNKRIVKSYLIYFVFDAILTVITFLLTFFNVIDFKDNTISTVLFIFSGIVCICVYGNNYFKSIDWRFYESLRPDTLTKLFAIFLVANGILLLLSFSLAGVHISIVASWGGASLSALFNNIAAYLDDLNKMYTTSKYDTAIKFLKFWSIFILIAMFAYGYSSIGKYNYMAFNFNNSNV